ncbi:MAG: hypothetical protein HYY00_02660 [Chloroflexi bacterium]|nr:hypothetical protein [Chloroflexota bacterium]
MTRATSVVDDILKALPTLTKTERRRLLEGLCANPHLMEDLHDIVTLLERRDEPSRPYEEFVQELKAEGKL